MSSHPAVTSACDRSTARHTHTHLMNRILFIQLHNSGLLCYLLCVATFLL